MELELRAGVASMVSSLEQFQEVGCATPEMLLRENESGCLDRLRWVSRLGGWEESGVHVRSSLRGEGKRVQRDEPEGLRDAGRPTLGVTRFKDSGAPDVI